jgi:hypothetical protein
MKTSTIFTTLTRALLGLFLTVLISACGGGGGGGGSPPPTGTPACVWGSTNWNQCNWQ